MPTCAWRLAAHCCTARGAVPLWWQAMHAWLSLDVPPASLEMSGVVGAPPCAKAETTARGAPHSKTMNGRARGSYFICGAPFPLPLFVGLRVAGSRKQSIRLGPSNNVDEPNYKSRRPLRRTPMLESTLDGGPSGVFYHN